MSFLFVHFTVSQGMSWEICCPHLHLRMLSFQLVEYLWLKRWIVVAHSEVSLDLVENRICLEVGNDTFVIRGFTNCGEYVGGNRVTVSKV
jgi:hypothetical protein